MMTAQKNSERGLTLIELMIGMVVGSILMAFILGSVANLTAAYKNQDKLNAQTQSLRSGRDLLVREARMAGRLITRFRIATGALGASLTTDLSPIMVVNGGGTTPDTLRLYYADGTFQMPVTAFTADTATVADSSMFHENDVVALVGPRLVPGPVPGSMMVEYEACILRVTAVVGGADAGPGASVVFDNGGAPYNELGNNHCDNVRTLSGLFLAPFVARSFRINTTNATLEMSANGELETNAAWETVALEFANLQIASQYFEPSHATDSDGDGDPERDWYSSSSQHEPDPTGHRPAGARLTMLSLGLATRSQVSSVASSTTPAFTNTVNVNYNAFGDSPEQAVTTPHVYRNTRILVDLRNMAIGL
jgi:prepilin-type N-terminal cleavage/methylation domain-containing protein